MIVEDKYLPALLARMTILIKKKKLTLRYEDIRQMDISLIEIFRDNLLTYDYKYHEEVLCLGCGALHTHQAAVPHSLIRNCRYCMSEYDPNIFQLLEASKNMSYEQREYMKQILLTSLW